MAIAAGTVTPDVQDGTRAASIRGKVTPKKMAASAYTAGIDQFGMLEWFVCNKRLRIVTGDAAIRREGVVSDGFEENPSERSAPAS